MKKCKPGLNWASILGIAIFILVLYAIYPPQPFPSHIMEGFAPPPHVYEIAHSRAYVPDAATKLSKNLHQAQMVSLAQSYYDNDMDVGALGEASCPVNRPEIPVLTRPACFEESDAANDTSPEPDDTDGVDDSNPDYNSKVSDNLFISWLHSNNNEDTSCPGDSDE